MTFDWQGANETDVREELLCHLLRRLGYKRNSANQILTEHHVFYDRATLGRKKVNDPKMMGKIDYLLKVGGSARWVLEAKAPKTLTQQDIDQVLTYARHPEVAAVYAAICNGKEFRLYSSNQMSDEQPLLQFDVVSIQDAEERLSATLHPDCINRDFKSDDVMRWQKIPGILEISFFRKYEEGGAATSKIDYAYIKGFTE